MNTADIAKLLGMPELPALLARVEACMLTAIAGVGPSLNVTLTRVIRSKGKRLRPVLVLAAAASQGGKIDQTVVRAAASVELAHLATLVHDDILDQAATRWGNPTVHSLEGTSQAIVAGDYLLAISIAEAAAVSQSAGRELAVAIATVCDGQSQETADDYNTERTLTSYYEAIRKKTAVLLAAACKIGGLTAGLPPGQPEALEAYGEAFGMAFQIADDILDFTASAETMGKPVGNDAKTGVYSLPLLLALQGSQAQTIRSWLGKTPQQPLVTEQLRAALQKSGQLNQAITIAQTYAQTASAALQGLPSDSRMVAGLARLPADYLASSLPELKRTTECLSGLRGRGCRPG